MSDRNKITAPNEIAVPTFVFNGVPFFILADMPLGGFVQFVNGENPLGQVVPGMAIAKGCMVVVVAPEYAVHIRPQLRQLEKGKAEALRQAGVIQPH